MYNPLDWYWKKDNETQAFSSVRQLMVAANDTGLVAHIEANGGVSRWPLDEQGEQTTVALQEMLSPYNIFVTLFSYAENARWKREQRGVTSGGLTVLTDDRSKTMLMGARIAASADENFTTPWVTNNGTIVTLTAEQVIAVSDSVLAHVQQCFVIFASVKTGIENNTITTHEQIDTAFEA